MLAGIFLFLCRYNKPYPLKGEVGNHILEIPVSLAGIFYYMFLPALVFFLRSFATSA